MVAFEHSRSDEFEIVKPSEQAPRIECGGTTAHASSRRMRLRLLSLLSAGALVTPFTTCSSEESSSALAARCNGRSSESGTNFRVSVPEAFDQRGAGGVGV